MPRFSASPITACISASPTFSPRQSLRTETRPIWPSGNSRAVPIGKSPSKARKCTAPLSSASHSSSGGTDCSAMNTDSRMRRISAISFCQSATRTWILFISKPQAALLDQLAQQAAAVFVVQPVTKVIGVQGVSSADQLQQLAQFARQVTALAAGEQQQVVIDFGPGHARAWVANKHSTLFQAGEEVFFFDFFRADHQFRVARLGHVLAEPGQQQALIAHVIGQQSFQAIKVVVLDLVRIDRRY